jgi:hypothetical protein
MVKKHGWCTAAALAGLLSTVSGTSSAAKPPDLPVDQGVTCPEGRESDPSAPKRPALPGGREEMPVVVDVVMPALLPRLLAEVLQPRPAETAQPANRDEEARHIFRIGEQCQRQGDLDKARTCYEEAHLLSPTSRHGRLAMQRLHELEQGRGSGGGEEQEEPPTRRTPTTAEPPLQEPPSPEQSYRQMLQRTQPLGLSYRPY